MQAYLIAVGITTTFGLHVNLQPFRVSECPNGRAEGGSSIFPDSIASQPRVLVAVLSSTRAEELTYNSFERYLIDPLHADLALAVSESGGGAHSVRSGPYYRRAKFIWEMPEPRSNDYGPLFENLAEVCNNRTTFITDLKQHLIPHGNWLGGIRSCGGCDGSGAIQMWFRLFLWQNLVKSGVLSSYDTLILTRSDHLYIAPHPPIPRMQQDQILAVTGQDYGGLCDRHFIVPMTGAAHFLGMAGHVTSKSVTEIFGKSDINAETSIRMYLDWHHMKVARFRRTMFLIRDPADKDTAWSADHHTEMSTNEGYIVKYRDEYNEAQATAQWLAQQNNSWGTFAPTYVRQALDRLRPPLPMSYGHHGESMLSHIAHATHAETSPLFEKKLVTQDPDVSPATSGKPYEMVRSRAYSGPVPDFNIGPLPGESDSFCVSKLWAVVTTIFEVTTAVHQLNSAPNWCTLVVADEKSLASNQYLANATRVKYLTPEEQRSLGFRSLMHTPWNHFSRKNIGFLYAMRQGAEIILDFDDDNELLPGLGPVTSLQDAEVSGRVQKVRDMGPVNPYLFFQPSSHVWPRGLPLNKAGNDILNCTETAMPDNIAVLQHLARINPDVDAIWRLTQTSPFDFDSRHETLVLGSGTWSPFNAQATTWTKTGFAVMRLPSTVHGRVSDIWRSYIAQPLLWNMNASVAFTSPRFSVPHRNPHNLEGDFESEWPLYRQAGALIDHLTIKSQQLQGKHHHQALFSIYTDLYEHGILEYEDVLATKAWIEDLLELGL
jgi:hypothetical protein